MKMRLKIKRILTFVLLICLLVGMVPINTVYAAESKFPGVEILPSDFKESQMNISSVAQWDGVYSFLTGNEGDMTDPAYLAEYIYTRLDCSGSDVLEEGYQLYEVGQYTEALKKYRNYFIEKMRKVYLGLYPDTTYDKEIWLDRDKMVVGEMTIEEYLQKYNSDSYTKDILSSYGSPYDDNGELNYIGKTGYEGTIDWMGGYGTDDAAAQFTFRLHHFRHLPYSWYSEENDIYKDKWFQVMSELAVNYKPTVDAYALNNGLHVNNVSDSRFYNWDAMLNGAERVTIILGGLNMLVKFLPAEGEVTMPEFSHYTDIPEPVGPANPDYYDEIPVIPFSQLIVHVLNSEMVLLDCCRHAGHAINWQTAGLNAMARVCTIFSEFELLDGANEVVGESLSAVWNTRFKDGTYLEQSFNYNDDEYSSGLGLIKTVASTGAETEWAVSYKNSAVYYERFKEGFQSSALLLPKVGNGGDNLQLAEIWKDSSALEAYKTSNNYTADENIPLYNSIYFPYGGYATLRSGWEIENDMSLSTWNSEYMGNGHHSPYINAVWLTAYGRPLIMSGEGALYTTSVIPEDEEPYRAKWNEYFGEYSTKKGSTVMVNGLNQAIYSDEYPIRQTATGATIVDARFGTSDYFDYIEGNFQIGYGAEAYDANETGAGKALPGQDTSHMRQNIMVREADLWIITDTMTNTGEDGNEYSQIWRFPTSSTEYENYNGFTNDQVVVDAETNTIKTHDPDTVNLFMTQVSNEELSYQKYYGSRGDEEGGDNEYRGWTAQGIQGVRMPSADVYVRWTDSAANKNTQVITVATPSKTHEQPYESLTPKNDASKGITGFELTTKNGVVVTNYAATTAVEMEAAGVKATATNLTVTENEGVIRGVVLDCDSISYNDSALTTSATSFEFEVQDGSVVVTNLIAVPDTFEWVDTEDGKYYPVYVDTRTDDEVLADALTIVENAFEDVSVEQKDVATAEAAKAYAESLIAALDLSNASASVATVEFIAATAGTDEAPDGISGSYTFIVTLTKGEGTPVTTKNLTITIIAEEYVEEETIVTIPDDVNKVSVKTLTVDAEKWQSFNATPTFDGGMMSLDTLTSSNLASAGYGGQKYKNTVFEFTYKAETSAEQGKGWTGLYLDMNNPGTTYPWSIKGVLVTLYDNRSELQIYHNDGVTIAGDKTVPFEIGKTYDMQFGMYDVSDTEVRIVVTADGKTIWNEVIENELLVGAESYFCVTAAEYNKAIVGEKVVEPDKVSVNTLTADAENWQSFNATPTFDSGRMSLDTLTSSNLASAGYGGQKYKNTVFEFPYKAETSAEQGKGWTGLYLDMNNPGTTYPWSIKGVLVTLYDNRSELQIYHNDGVTIAGDKTVPFEIGETYDMQFGMYDVNDTAVRIVVTADGNTIWNEVIENELLVGAESYFCVTAAEYNKAIVGEKVVEPTYVNVGTLIADAEKWQYTNRAPKFDEGVATLTSNGDTVYAGYGGQTFKNTVFDFTYNHVLDGTTTSDISLVYLHDKPGTGGHSYGTSIVVAFYPNKTRLNVMVGSKSVYAEDNTDVVLESGVTYDTQIGMYDVSDTEVKIIVTVGGKTVFDKVVANESLVSKDYYFCFGGFSGTIATIGEKLEEEEDTSAPAIIPEESDEFVIYGNTATISSDADYTGLLNVMVDGEVVDASNYTVGYRTVAAAFSVRSNTEESGTAVTFNSDYLATLSAGDHTVKLNFEGDVSASTVLTVLPAATGENYSVAVIGSQNKVVNEQAVVSIMPYHASKDTWNAVDLTLTYDTSKLTLVTETLEGYTVEHDSENGIIQIIGYGKDKTCGLDTIELAFTANEVGDAAVTLIAAKVDESANAIANDAPEATIATATATITITGYMVTLPDGFIGEATTTPGEDYTFIVDNTNYDYVFTAEVNGEEVAITGSGTSQDPYRIAAAALTGNLVIKLESRTAKTFDVSITDGADVTGANKATYGEDYTFSITKQEGYSYSVPTVTINGQAYTAYTVSGDSYTIPGVDIVGEISITVVKTAIDANQVTVTVQGTGAGDVVAEAKATKNTAFSFTVNKINGYKYTVQATVGGVAVTLTGEGTTENPYAIAAEAVTDSIVITVNKELIAYTLTTTVSEYLKLQETSSVFLVKTAVEGVLPEGKIPTYDGNGMYWSEQYNAYCWLVISGNTSDAVKAAAEEKIAVAEATGVTIDYKGDVNLTGVVDINDAQLAYDMYNAKYSDFAAVSMQKFLSADVNADAVVNVSDATAIVNIILSGN